MRVLFETLYERYFDGWCAAARAYARGMERGGAEVSLHSWQPQVEPLHPLVAEEVGHMVKPMPKPDVYVWSGTFGGPLEMVPVLLSVLRIRKNYGVPVAFYTMFERTNVQKEMVPLLNQLDGVLVPCEANLWALERAGVTNAVWVRAPYFDDDPHLVLTTPKKPPRTFYWIGRWEPRKAPHNVIRAFMRAFDPERDDVELVLKVGPSKWWRSFYAGPEQAIENALVEKESGNWDRWHAAKRIKVVTDLLSPEQMLDLHRRGDVYVSASRGEGIDMPAFAAKLAGRRVVTTACGGPEDFLSDTDLLVQSTGELALPDYDAIWGRDSTAVDYDLDDLVWSLRDAFTRADCPESGPALSEHRVEVVGWRLGLWLKSLVNRDKKRGVA